MTTSILCPIGIEHAKNCPKIQRIHSYIYTTLTISKCCVPVYYSNFPFGKKWTDLVEIIGAVSKSYLFVS